MITKSTSTLSPDLQKLATAGRKAATALGKPVAPGMSDLAPFLQIRGDKVRIDVTAKEDVASAEAELRQLGATITASYGRVISATMPIGALPQLEGSSTIRFARPAYKPMHLGHAAAGSFRAAAGSFGAAVSGAKPVPVISQGDTAQLSYLATLTLAAPLPA
jgi:hypothetical protein